MCSVRILIVEDDPDLTRLIQAALESEFDLLVAHNGLEALQMALAGEPDLIISDIMMPVLDGHEMMRRLRKYSVLEKIPVIYLSALGSQDQIRKGYDLGAALYLTKPIDPNRLKRNVELFITDHGVEPKTKSQTVAVIQQKFSEPLPGVGGGKMVTPTPYPRSEQKTPVEGRTRQKTPVPTPPPTEKKPEAASQPKPAEKPAAKPAAPPALVRLLVVDGDRKLTAHIVGQFRRDYETLTADDGIEAIERAARYQPDIFIVDANITKMNGYQLVQMLKKNPAFKNNPIIFTSEKDNNRDRQYVARLGVQFFLHKPYTDEDLTNVIDQAINEPFFEIRKDRIDFRTALVELSVSGEIEDSADEPRRVAKALKAEKPERWEVASEKEKDPWEG